MVLYLARPISPPAHEFLIEEIMNMEDVRAIARGGRVFDLGVELFPGVPYASLHSPLCIP